MACKTLRIGVFFDGTDNSKKNEEEYSNVAKLHELYDFGNEENEDGDIIETYESIYIIGLGHGEGEEVSCIGVHSDVGGGFFYT